MKGYHFELSFFISFEWLHKQIDYSSYISVHLWKVYILICCLSMCDKWNTKRTTFLVCYLLSYTSFNNELLWIWENYNRCPDCSSHSRFSLKWAKSKVKKTSEITNAWLTRVHKTVCAVNALFSFTVLCKC